MSKNLAKYFLMGPSAVEKRLFELEQKLIRTTVWLGKLTSLRVRYGGLIERGTNSMARTLIKTIREIRNERRKLESLIGGSLRVWEVKKADPAPSV